MIKNVLYLMYTHPPTHTITELCSFTGSLVQSTHNLQNLQAMYFVTTLTCRSLYSCVCMYVHVSHCVCLIRCIPQFKLLVWWKLWYHILGKIKNLIYLIYCNFGISNYTTEPMNISWNGPCLYPLVNSLYSWNSVSTELY